MRPADGQNALHDLAWLRRKDDGYPGGVSKHPKTITPKEFLVLHALNDFLIPLDVAMIGNLTRLRSSEDTTRALHTLLRQGRVNCEQFDGRRNSRSLKELWSIADSGRAFLEQGPNAVKTKRDSDLPALKSSMACATLARGLQSQLRQLWLDRSLGKLKPALSGGQGAILTSLGNRMRSPLELSLEAGLSWPEVENILIGLERIGVVEIGVPDEVRKTANNWCAVNEHWTDLLAQIDALTAYCTNASLLGEVLAPSSQIRIEPAATQSLVL